MQLTCYALVAVAMAIGVLQLIGIVTLWFDPVDMCLQPVWTLPMVAAIIAALGCSILAIAECRGIDRQRATWTLVPLPFVYLAFQALLFINFTSPAYGVVMGSKILDSAITFVAPLVLTYAAVNRKLIDVGFVLNRTLVFATVSAIVVGVFVLAEWAASEWFVSASHTSSVVVGMLVALALGLSMRYIHKYVDRFVDRVFFQKRHEDEAALRAFAHEASYITDRCILLDRSVQAVRRHTDTDDVAIFLRGDSGLYRECTNGRAAVVSENDSAVLALKAWGEPLDLDEANGSQLPGAIAFPMTARGVLIGTLVCGPKASGESFAPDEIESLAALAHGVAVALDSLSRESADSIASLRETVAGLQSSIATMQERVVAELRALGNALRS